jgi:hypothetical protein
VGNFSDRVWGAFRDPYQRRHWGPCNSSTRNAIHADVGLIIAGVVIVHLAQRRHRIARMLTRLTSFRPGVERELRLVASDVILTLITINVVVSGILDWAGELFYSYPSHGHSTGGT